MRIRHLSALGLLALMCIPTSALAQNSTTGAIQGVVRDQATDEGLAGVTVVVTSPALQGTQSAITEGSGQYKITNLPPGTYSATYYYSDITVRRNNILVSINKTTPAYIKINTNQAGGEVIVIEDKAPTIDPTSTTQGVTLDQEYTKNIPVPGRTFTSALGAAPGSAGDDLGVSFSGSTSLENSYVVDGVNTTGLTYGTVGSPLINDFIEEIEIITGGYNAEYGRATGGVVNVVTKSGSNEFHGTVFSYVSPGFLIASTHRTPTESSSIDYNSNMAYNMDFGFDLGGPIVKDKVWFYVGFAPRLARLDVDKITKRRTDCRTLLPDGSLSECDPDQYADGNPDEDPATGFLIFEDLDKERKNAQQTSYQFVSKVNFAVAPEHQGQISLIGTPRSGESVGVNGDPSATTVDYNELTTDLSGKWTSKFNNNKTEVEAVLGWHRSTYEQDSINNAANDLPLQVLVYGQLYDFAEAWGFETEKTKAGCFDSRVPNSGDPYPFIDNCPDEGVGYRIGGPGGIFDEKEERMSARVSATQRIKAIGNHEVKAGADLEDNTYLNVRHISGNVWYQLDLYNKYTYATRWVALEPPGESDPKYNAICRDASRIDPWACEWLGPNDVLGKTFNWSSYIRDSWQPMPNLTLNYGLRYEEQRLRYADALQNTPDPFTGNMRGTNAMVMRNMWAPRFGAMYDWTKEGRSKIYGHWGRFYESIPMDINNRSFGGETMYQQIFNADDETQCGTENRPGFNGPNGPDCTVEANPSDPPGTKVAGVSETLFGSGVLVAPGIKAQYLDEFIVGVEYEVLEDLKLGLSYQNRRLGRVVEDVSVDQAETYILANPGEWSSDEESKLIDQIADLEASGGDINEINRLKHNLEQYQGIRTFDKPRRDYHAVQVTATKRFSRQFYLQASYTYSRSLGNFPGLYSADNGQVDPNITSQFDLIELLANRDGPLPQDRPHYIKVDGYYIMDFKKAGELTLGARVRALSGTPINALAKHYMYGYNESFLLPRGEMGRTDFDYGLDLHLSYGRDLGKGMSLELFTDVFSVFNRQSQYDVSATYTLDPANPVVGGEYSDLVFAKRQNDDGNETALPLTRYRNFLNTTVRYSPLSARIGARLTF